MFILKKGHQPGVYVPLRALFLVANIFYHCLLRSELAIENYDSNLLCLSAHMIHLLKL